jgi:hypothetical protein
MLEFAEAVQNSIRKLHRETEAMLVAGKPQNMEQYKFLLGRLEGFKFVDEAVKDLLTRNPDN